MMQRYGSFLRASRPHPLHFGRTQNVTFATGTAFQMPHYTGNASISSLSRFTKSIVPSPSGKDFLHQQLFLVSTQTRQPEESKSRKKARSRRALKPPLQLTPKAQSFFLSLASQNVDKLIELQFHQSSTGEPRMVFAFDFIGEQDLTKLHEKVALATSEEDEEEDLLFLYIHPNALLKVLGGTLDVDLETLKPILYDKEGNEMDPNA